MLYAFASGLQCGQHYRINAVAADISSYSDVNSFPMNIDDVKLLNATQAFVAFIR